MLVLPFHHLSFRIGHNQINLAAQLLLMRNYFRITTFYRELYRNGSWLQSLQESRVPTHTPRSPSRGTPFVGNERLDNRETREAGLLHASRRICPMASLRVQRDAVPTQGGAFRAARRFLYNEILVSQNPCQQTVNETDRCKAHGLITLPIHAVSTHWV